MPRSSKPLSYGIVIRKTSSRAAMAWSALYPGAAAPLILGSAILVKAHGEFRSVARLEACHRRQRNHSAFVIANVELANIFRLGAIVAFRFDVDLPLPAESVEVVDEVAAHECLQRLVHVPDGGTLLHNFFSFHLRVQLRHARKRSGAESRKFRAFPRLGEEGLEIRRQKLEVRAGPVR